MLNANADDSSLTSFSTTKSPISGTKYFLFPQKYSMQLPQNHKTP